MPSGTMGDPKKVETTRLEQYRGGGMNELEEHRKVRTEAILNRLLDFR